MAFLTGPQSRRRRLSRSARPRGFTLIEVMVVVALIGVAAAVVTFALRDPNASQLEQEAARLQALLESARAESRASGVPVLWVPQAVPDADEQGQPRHFRFLGLPPTILLPQRWLNEETAAEVVGRRELRLGPEPMIGAQRVALRLGDQRVVLGTDGLGPFVAVPGGADDAPAR